MLNLDKFMRMVQGKGAELVNKSAALRGRANSTRVSDTHFVLKGHKMKGPWDAPLQTAVFATGCFWGAEKGFWRMPGVYTTAVGYCAGYTPNPTYEVSDKCTGSRTLKRCCYFLI